MYEKLFSRRGLSLERLKVFLEVADAGGIAKATGTDPVRQSQYSRQLKELAGYFGVELIQRRGRSLKLTPAGERLARVIRESFSSLDDFGKACAEEPLRFRIGAGDSLIQWLLLPGIGRLRREFPRLILRVDNLRTREIVSGLQEMSLDFGICRRDAVPRNLKWKPLGQVKYALYAPRELLPRKNVPPLSWVLQNLPVAKQSGDRQVGRVLEEVSEKIGTPLDILLECESFPHAMRALQSGACAAILPQIAGRDLDPARHVEITSPHFRALDRQMVLTWNPRTLQLRESADRLCQSLAGLYRF